MGWRPANFAYDIAYTFEWNMASEENASLSQFHN